MHSCPARSSAVTIRNIVVCPPEPAPGGTHTQATLSGSPARDRGGRGEHPARGGDLAGAQQVGTVERQATVARGRELRRGASQQPGGHRRAAFAAQQSRGLSDALRRAGVAHSVIRSGRRPAAPRDRRARRYGDVGALHGARVLVGPLDELPAASDPADEERDRAAEREDEAEGQQQDLQADAVVDHDPARAPELGDQRLVVPVEALALQPRRDAEVVAQAVDGGVGQLLGRLGASAPGRRHR